MVQHVAGRQLMICSEFVYRTYEEALPAEEDAYHLHIDGTLFGFTRSVGVQGAGIHPQSLLAYMAQQTSPIAPQGFDAVDLSSVMPATTDQTEIEHMLTQYLDEAAPGVATTRLTRPQMQALQASALGFGRALSSHPASQAARPFMPAFSATAAVPAGQALQGLLDTAAQFVTPGDLLKTRSLITVGEY
jgi:hypothetical protein